jgi:protein involved in polysaccharide export with SLBB domain
MLNHYIKRLAALSAISILCFVLGGCIGFIPSPFRPFPGPAKTPADRDLAEAFDIVCRNYRLGSDDVISVNFQTEWSIPEGSYKLDTLDEIEIEFILEPELNRRVTVRPDGMVSLPGIGDVKAVGLTPEELGKSVEKKYRQANILRNGESDPQFKLYRMVTVSVSQFYQKEKKLVDSLTTLTNGQNTQVTVKPDGTIDLPLLKDRVLAAGSTVADVEQTVNRLYKEGPLKHAVASLALSNARSRKVYILGEVKTPGAYDVKQPITALQAIALAGGHNVDTADLTSAILISKDINGRPIGRRLDLKRILDVGDMSAAILVKPYDVIYVPKTYIRDLRVFMEQYFATIAQVADFIDTVRTIETKK